MIYVNEAKYQMAEGHQGWILAGHGNPLDNQRSRSADWPREALPSDAVRGHDGIADLSASG